ncbi:unnamed protein product [Lactuca saligna]|uniref:Uncharacterized protein n=1 Tax=Lactuca saligna TaxID=75948 RepID=A0AA36E8Q2_LACSI|nr:unnamed protein product [Lactuca saligna]
MKAFEARIVSKVSGMIKDIESKILEKVDQSDHTTELRINSFNTKYVGAVKELTNVQKERHTLFVMDVKKLREDVNLKLQELRDDMLYESLSPQITQLSTTDNQQFGEVIAMLKDLKDALLIQPWVQGGEKRVGEASHAKARGEASQGEVKVFGKNFPSKLPSSKPTISSVGPVTSTIVTSMPIMKPISKGVVIGSSTDQADSSKAKDATQKSTGKGKLIVVEKSKEEKKAEAKAEIEKLGVVQSIMRQSASDPPGLNKRDPAKHYNYETIKAKVAFRHMYAFEKKPKQSYVVSNPDMSQLDFPINEMMFLMPQFKMSDKFKSEDVYNYLKLHFHAVLTKAPEEIWLLITHNTHKGYIDS